jgi:hypothetical protein
MEKKTLLVAEHIDKRFGITHAVNDVSLTIAAGEIRGAMESRYSFLLAESLPSISISTL